MTHGEKVYYGSESLLIHGQLERQCGSVIERQIRNLESRGSNPLRVTERTKVFSSCSPLTLSWWGELMFKETGKEKPDKTLERGGFET